jgi:predicted nucleic acid-binding protein
LTSNLNVTEWSREWWEKYANKFELTSSVAVIDELQQGISQHTENRIILLEKLSLLEINQEIIDIAQIYIDHLVMPNDPKGDALHLAIACYHKIDSLFTWNCKHIANANKLDHIRRINFQIGLPTPILATPLNYFTNLLTVIQSR